MKRNSGVVPAMAVAAITSFMGYALISLSAEQRVTERRAAAAQLAAASAYSVERQLEGAFATVYALTEEIREGGNIDDFKALAAGATEGGTDAPNLLFVSEGRIADRYPFRAEGAGFEKLPVGDWTSDVNTATKPLVRSTALLGPVRMASGELAVFVRWPLCFTHQAGSKHFVGWVAASLQLDKLVDSSGLKRLPNSGYDYQLSYIDPNGGRQRTFLRSTEFDLKAPVKQLIHLAQNQWSLSIAPRDGWSPWSPILLHSVLVGMLALTGAVATYDLTKRREWFRREVEKRDRRLKIVNRRLTEEIQQHGELEKQLSHASVHDGLTGLPNRPYFMNRLERALSRARRQPGSQLAVIVLNFDRFKNVNENLGYAAGDELLTQAVQRFENCLRPEDIVGARLGGDEFAMLLFDLSTPNDATTVAQRLQNALAEPFSLEGQIVFTTASIGIALSSSGYDHADELLRGAHIALSKAKADGRARCAVFDPAVRDQIGGRQQLEADLHRAIERREFRLNFQPIVSLQTGHIVGMEVLVRWHHPLEGMVFPDRFIPLAEETGLIVPIDRWVLREAGLQARVWRGQFPSDVDFYLTVNLSAQDLRQPDLCDYVARVLQETGLPPGLLRLEVTERMMIGNVTAASDLVSRLREMGVPLLLDDFGTGYSSLSYLHRFKFDFVKIDRAFVSRITPGGQNTGIVRAIVHLAQDLGMKTIAEGVETLENMKQLRVLGCDYGQGYYFSKPVEVELAEKLLLSRPKW